MKVTFSLPICPLREEKSLSQRAFSIYTDIRKLQDKAKTSYKEFDVVLNMADGAVGYLEDDGENHKIFSVIAKPLKNGGKHCILRLNSAFFSEIQST